MEETRESPTGEILSATWVDPEPELRFVNGVWVAVRRGRHHPSSALARGRHKPRSLREKLELEAARKAAEEERSTEGEPEGSGSGDNAG